MIQDPAERMDPQLDNVFILNGHCIDLSNYIFILLCFLRASPAFLMFLCGGYWEVGRSGEWGLIESLLMRRIRDFLIQERDDEMEWG